MWQAFRGLPLKFKLVWLLALNISRVSPTAWRTLFWLACVTGVLLWLGGDL